MKIIRLWKLFICCFLSVFLLNFSGCQNRRTEIVWDTQEDNRTEDEQQSTEEESKDSISIPTETVQPELSPEPEEIFVDVCGAVVSPGVYELDTESRVFQAIEAAGGFLPDAAASAVNQAQPVCDGQQIYVPTQEEAESGLSPVETGDVQTGVSESEGNLDSSIVNLNTADAEALKTLSGIGDAKAQAILAYREEHGEFSSIEEIMQVPGIKESTFFAIKDKIAVK